jgi:hypothetical protein
MELQCSPLIYLSATTRPWCDPCACLPAVSGKKAAHVALGVLRAKQAAAAGGATRPAASNAWQP